jgi:ABC-type amino acid transport system permease subunit
MPPVVTAKLKNFINYKIVFVQMYAGVFEHMRDQKGREADTGESFSNISALASIYFSNCYIIRCVLRYLEGVFLTAPLTQRYDVT